MNNITFRFAEKKDSDLIFLFIKKLAEYEHMENEVVATPQLLEEWIFEKKKAEVLFPIVDGKEIGFALFFNNFSTFLGRAGIYLEDLYILPEFRGKGYGTAVFHELAKITVARDCGRLEWCCLDWNEPSIKFYLGLGATQLSDWTTYRLTGEKLQKLSEK